MVFQPRIVTELIGAAGENQANRVLQIAAVGDEVVRGLRERGHDVTVAPPWSLGRVSAVERDDGQLRAAANARGMQGYAVAR